MDRTDTTKFGRRTQRTNSKRHETTQKDADAHVTGASKTKPLKRWEHTHTIRAENSAKLGDEVTKNGENCVTVLLSPCAIHFCGLDFFLLLDKKQKKN